METNIKKEATELVTHGPQTALRISESTPIEVSRQGASHTNFPADTNFWLEGEYHPYYRVNENLEYAEWKLEKASEKRGKKICAQKLEEARDYVRCAIILLPLDRDIEVRASLISVLATLPRSADAEKWDLSLQELKAAAKHAIAIVEDVRQKIPDLIVADEDARYPGCRNEEGELIVGGLNK